MDGEFPDDSDGRVLKMMAERGLDMSRPVKFEFSIHVEDEENAKIVLEGLKAAGVGDAKEIIFDEGELEDGEEMTKENEEFWPSWTVYVYQSMVPGYERVIEFQRTLAEICKEHGKPDGWTVELN